MGYFHAMGRASVIAAATVLAWAAWAWVAIVPEWTGGRADVNTVDMQVRDRLVLETAYNAGWLSWYHERNGAFPDTLPPNRAGAGNRKMVEVCPRTRQDLISSKADWAFCPEDGRVRALYRNPGYLPSLAAPPDPGLFPREEKGGATPPPQQVAPFQSPTAP